MAYYGKLNWLETRIDVDVKTEYNPADQTQWAGNVAYKAAQKADNAYHTYGTTVVQSESTYGDTPSLKKIISRMYSTKQTIGGKKNRQYYREMIVYHISGFLTCLKDSIFAGIANKYQRVWFCNDYPHTEVGAGVIPQPNAFKVNYEDVDIEGTGKDAQLSSYSRDTSGYIKRNRVRSNVATIEMTWEYLTAEETKNILKAISGSQYIRVCYMDPLTNGEATKVMYNSSRDVEATVRGNYKSLNVTLVQV